MQDIRGIDFNAMQKAAGSSLVNMENAGIIYMSLVKQAETSPYNQAVIAGLKHFDYQSFMQENNLNQMPVVREGKVIGLITRDNLIRLIHTRSKLGM